MRDYKLIKELCKNLNKNELYKANLPGFYFPSDFFIDNLLEICKKDYKKHCLNLCKAISENDKEHIKSLSLDNQIFLLAILFLCYIELKCWFNESFYILFLNIIKKAPNPKLNILMQLLDILEASLNTKVDIFNYIIVLYKMAILYKQNKDAKKEIEKLSILFKKRVDEFEVKEYEEEFYNILFRIIKDKSLKEHVLEIITRSL